MRWPRLVLQREMALDLSATQLISAQRERAAATGAVPAPGGRWWDLRAAGHNRGVRVILCGANPGVRLLDGDTVTAFASVWVVDWSERGAGKAIVLWHDGVVRVLAGDPALGEWLERAFVRHFPEVEGLPWAQPTPERAAVDVRLDLGQGLVARAGDVEVTMSGVLDRRAFATDEFMLDGVAHGLRLVVAPASDATIDVGGRRLPGAVTVGGTPGRPSSSAFLTTAEVWLR